MTTATALVDRNLEEQIFQLQRADLDPPVRQIVDEAAQLLAQGHHLEAGALIEKAEAMRDVTPGAQPPAQPLSPAGADQRPDARAEAITRLASDLTSGIAGGIAEGIARVIGGAIHTLEENILGETRAFNSSVDQKFATLQAAVETLLPVRAQIDQLTDAVSQQRAAGFAVEQKCEQLAAATASLQEADTWHEAGLAAVRSQMQDFSASVTGRVDSISAKLESQGEDLSSLKSTVADLSPSVVDLVQRLDRQAGAIRSLYDAQTQREATLEQLITALTQLKPSHLPAAMPEGQL
jgi:ABC-type transporter Mla subunit MlaD